MGKDSHFFFRDEFTEIEIHLFFFFKLLQKLRCRSASAEDQTVQASAHECWQAACSSQVVQWGNEYLARFKASATDDEVGALESYKTWTQKKKAKLHAGFKQIGWFFGMGEGRG